MKLRDIRIDSERREAGDWHAYDEVGVAFKVRGEGNTDWLAASASIERTVRVRDGVLRGDLSPAQRREVQVGVLLEAGLLDWRGLEGDDGQPLAFSKEVARELLMDPDFDVLLGLVVGACRAMSFLAPKDGDKGPAAEELDAAAGN